MLYYRNSNITAAILQSSHQVFASRAHNRPELLAFTLVTVDEVLKLLTLMSCETSPLDVLPISRLKDCAHVFAPAITRTRHANLSGGTRQVVASNYRPILNLSTVSKVLACLRPNLTNTMNFSQRQSAYRQVHSTETMLFHVLENVYITADDKVIVLIGLDLSAAFNTVCHSTLIRQLQM